ncbi:MAG TPA: hypothetical protein VE338_12670 [Ktedonobacterales bacterium]|jgi:hypothetical protein|nr:hypothetical protein [Ktedonobacterales bacterium]
MSSSYYGSDYDADAEIAQAIAAFREARYCLARASFALEQRAVKTADPFRAVLLAADAGSLSALATMMSSAATSARAIRKAVRSLESKARA